jgi:Mn2+/Fe2+ NRAMP family transporter
VAQERAAPLSRPLADRAAGTLPAGARARDSSGRPDRAISRRYLLVLIGPGLMVMLADTDAGSVITAAQSGAQFGYRLVLAQVMLIPILYVVQETTARLGLATGQGHGALIRSTFGSRWALLSATALFAACVGALITEFAGIAGVGALVGIPRVASVGLSAVALSVLVLLGRYRRVEHIGIAVGALELLFIPAAILAHPHVEAVTQGMAQPLLTQGSYLTLLAANVGAVIMPWMIFYQQEAVIDKGRDGLSLVQAVRSARLDTAVGALITQVVMIAVLVATAATLGTASPDKTLNSIGDIASDLTPFFGHTTAVALFGLGMIGAAVVAALVVTLAGAWGLAEVLGWRHSLNDSPHRAGGFYALTVGGILAGALLVIADPDIVNLSIDVEVMNACLLPVVLGFLLRLERRALPADLRMGRPRQMVTYLLTGIVIAFGLLTAVRALAGVA